jgi:pimeloyl-ACP methyl ester carboxylesterase
MEITLPGTGFDGAVLDFSSGGGAWHFAFHMAPDVPEMLLTGKEHEYLTYFFQRAAYNPDAITLADIDEYMRCYTFPGAMRAYFEYYRTWLKDIEANTESAKNKLTIPVLVLVGDHTDTSHVPTIASRQPS